MGQEVNGAMLLLGRGKVYFDRLDSSGNRTGEIFLGNTPTFEVTPTPEEIKKYSSASAAADLMASDVIRVALEVSIVGDEFSKENLARAFYGDTSTISQTGTTVSDEPINGVLQDRYYPTEFRDISLVTVTGHVEGTDYEVDGTEGRIYIIEGGGITDDDDILVSYTYGTIALDTVRAMVVSSVKGYIRFVGDPARGPVYTAEFWRVSVRSDGAIGLISDEYAQWTLAGDIESDAVNHPNEPHMRIIKVSG